MPEKIKLTDTAVANLEPRHDGMLRVVWDHDLTGFAVRVARTGVKTFFIQYRTKLGKGKKLTLGRFPRITAEDARRSAANMLADVEHGGDPAAELAAARRREADKKARTVTEIAWLWQRDRHAKRKKTYKTEFDYVQWRVLPVIGHVPIECLKRSHIQKIFDHEPAMSISYARAVDAALRDLLKYAHQARFLSEDTYLVLTKRSRIVLTRYVRLQGSVPAKSASETERMEAAIRECAYDLKRAMGCRDHRWMEIVDDVHHRLALLGRGKLPSKVS